MLQETKQQRAIWRERGSHARGMPSHPAYLVHGNRARVKQEEVVDAIIVAKEQYE